MSVVLRRTAAPSARCARPARAARTALARRWALLVAGFAGWGVAASLMIRAGLGLGPWDAFHVGMHLHTGIGVGVASMLTGAAVLVASLALGIRPHVGTFLNMVLVGAFTDALLPHVPAASSAAVGIAYFATALVVGGWCTGAYMAADLGTGPRDRLVVELAERSGWSLGRVRTVSELSVLGLGWALGGSLGPGTLLFAFGIGPCMQWGMRRWGVLPADAPSRPALRPAGPAVATPATFEAPRLKRVA